MRHEKVECVRKLVDSKRAYCSNVYADLLCEIIDKGCEAFFYHYGRFKHYSSRPA